MPRRKMPDGVYAGPKLTGIEVEMIREVLDLFGGEANHVALAAEFSVHRTLISHIKRNVVWKETRV